MAPIANQKIKRALVSVSNKEGIVEWRKRVGEEVANHVMIQAANRGTAVHNMVEDYLNSHNSNSNILRLKLIRLC